jgi:sigma-B regulation protein RsbU (phosphoserine phosphatase)
MLIDTRGNSRIDLTLDMLREVSRQTDPNSAVTAFGARYGTLFPHDYYLSASIRGLGPGQYKITRSIPSAALRAAGATEIPPQNPWRDWATNPVRIGGFIGDIIARGTPQLLHNLAVRADPVLGDVLTDMGACIAVPLFDGGEPLNWSFTFRRDPQGYNEKDLEQSLLISNLFGATTRNLVSIEQIRQLNDRLTAQFEEVARVQQSLLPKQHPVVPGLKIATSYLPSDIAGGDYYDFFPLTDGRLGIMIADASGHGVGAATVMAMLHAILHSYPELDRGPGRALEYCNTRLLDAGMEGSFVTALLAIYDPATRELSHARAGHPLARLKHGSTGRVSALDGAAALPLGLMPYALDEEATVVLQRGDTVVLYTDGITEAFGGPDRRTMFGIDGLDAALELCSGDPECVMNTVHTELHEHTGSLTRADDQTLVAFRVVEE